jgi:PIN domain nuclease of toxin-antitoxin system
MFNDLENYISTYLSNSTEKANTKYQWEKIAVSLLSIWEIFRTGPTTKVVPNLQKPMFLPCD